MFGFDIMQFGIDFLEILNEMSPYLLLGFLFAGILNVLIPKSSVTKYLGKKDFKSVFLASLLGVPLPLCSCGVIPAGISFYKNGASKGATNSFLISTPQTGVDSILVTYSLLGLPFAIMRPFIAFVTGILGGLFTNKFDKEVNPNQAKETDTKQEKASLFDRLFKYAFVDFLQDIANWLVIGLLIAALISVAIPEDFFAEYLSNNFISMIVILIVAIPFYVCATSSVPIAAQLMIKGLSPGAALVFLMAGPATNAATITVIKNSMGRKALIAYLFSIISGALFFGFLVNEFLPSEWFGLGLMNGMHHHKHEFFPHWLQITSSIILVLLILNAYWLKYKSKIIKTKKNTHTTNLEGMKQISIIVNGMNCNHCKQNVLNVLNEISGIKDIEVDLATETATFSSDNVDLELIKIEVERIGYKYGGIKE